MKTTIKYPALLLIVCFAIWACTKKVETIISIDYEINEDFEGEGFVNSPLPTTVNIVPIQVLEGFDYFIKYEVVSGNGFYSSGSGIIAPNEFMPLTGLNFTANYIPSSQGTHTVKFTIRDEVGLEESTTLTYVISNLNLDWVAITNVGQAGIGQEIPITLTLANNTEGSTATFTRTVRLISGTATLSNSDGAVALNTKAGITPGTYNFTALASETGTLTIEFELEDSSGQTKTARVNIDIITEPVNQAPTAVAGADITNGTAPLTVRFDGSGSTDPEEGTLTYSWTLTNQSGTTVQTLTGSNPSFQFTNPGTYSATLTVTDAEDATGTDTVVITVSASDNVAPTASASSNVVSGPAPLTVNFDGSGSSDEDGTITGYSWDFGDGESGSGSTPSHIFTNPGTYTVTLTVTDDENTTGTDTIEITVSEPPNEAPTASASADVVSGSAPLTVNFDGSGSMDSDGTIASYSWELSNGVTLSGMSPEEYTFNTPGEYTATLTVTDNDGATATDIIDITVSEPANVAPTASASADVVSGPAPLTVNFDGSDSLDEDGTITGYRWNFGDGGTGSGTTPSHEFTNPGTYMVTLTVTDDENATGTVTIEITVLEPANVPPTASALLNESYAVGLTVDFDGSTSSDEDGTIVGYSWDFGDGESGEGPTPSHHYRNPGTYTVRLTVTDNNGAEDTDTLVITISSTSLNRSTGVFKAAPGALVSVSLQLGGSGSASFSFTSDPGGSISITLAPPGNVEDGFTFNMPDTGQVTFSADFSSLSGSAGGTAVIECFSESYTISLSLAQGTTFP